MDIILIIMASLTMGSVYGIVALCFQIVFKVTNIINFAQGPLVMVGGLIAFWGIMAPFKIPLALVFISTLTIAWMIGLVYEKLLVRPLINSSLIAIIMITLAALTLLQNAVDLATGKFPIRVQPYFGDYSFTIFNSNIHASNLLVIVVTILILLITKIFFDYTLAGKAMRAVGDNPMAAKLVGINPKKIISASFALSTTLAAVAGIIISPITCISGFIGFSLTIIGFTSAMLGGLKSPFSAVLGGYFFGFIESFTAFYISSAYKDGISFGVLILVLLFRPDGLFCFKGKGK